ncbi:MAG: hypothetical protein MZU97_16695 [Bacillus subtilis]|nr:hypothetical protein [Bacillus subtilis]
MILQLARRRVRLGIQRYVSAFGDEVFTTISCGADVLFARLPTRARNGLIRRRSKMQSRPTNTLSLSGYKGENIIIVGDSAGGGLALCAWTVSCATIKFRMPRAIITYVRLDGPRGGRRIVFAQCKRLTRCSVKAPRRLDAVGLCRNSNEMLKHPYVSPAYGDYDDFTYVDDACWDARSAWNPTRLRSRGKRVRAGK